ncbi:hypothetical protein ACN47E_005522 [Coniothyrium glycines]
MDSQGAGFAFDANMDFSNVFATPQEAFNKPEDNTSSFFFGDEAIDTTTGFSFDIMNPELLSTPQMCFDMQQPLTMDNTAGSASDWNQHLTPHMHTTLNTFPPTPTHSFESMYQATALGKRSLDTQTQELPRAKRLHGSSPDFTLYPSLETTASTWTLDNQPTPPNSIEMGLPDEAADVCATWFNKYNVLPSDRHIDSLSQLTGESADAVRSWFGRLLKQGMGGSQGDSAYKSQTGILQQQDSFWEDHFSANTLQPSPIELLLQQPDLAPSPQGACNHETITAPLPPTTLRGRKKRCIPTDDRSLLARDPSKIYQCTRKCGKRYGRKCDWKRNEEEGYPCKSWVCSLCKSEGVENVKPCFRKYHFAQHFRNIHPQLSADDYEETSIVSSDTEFPRQCGFCRHKFTCRQDRIDHIADHFKQGKSMLDWDDGEVSDPEGSDDNDNDDDDQSGGDGYDSSEPFYPPSQSHPSGDAGSKHLGEGGGSGSGGSGNGPSQGGFFQFQLAQLQEGGVEVGRHTIIEQLVRPCSLHSQQSSSTSGDEMAVARDVVSVLIRNQQLHELKHTKGLKTIGNGIVRHEDGHIFSDAEENGAIWPGARAIQDAVTASASQHHQQERGMYAMNDSSLIEQTGSIADEIVVKSLHGSIDSKVSSLTSRRTSSGKLPTIPTTSQSFLSIKLLGSGGFSTVDEVVHRETNLRIGRKTLKNRNHTATEELRKEVDVLQKLRHPHVIRFLGAYSKGDKMSILLSPVAETTLALWLERTASQMPANLTGTIVKMFGCLVSSVRYLHEQRPIVKHLDIKPQNILIVEGEEGLPHVVLSDFGVSTSEDLTNAQALPITRQYVAPEVFDGLARNETADIWSLGCVIAEMASVAFGQDNTRWLMFRKQFSGRQGKHYWQDNMAVQDGLTACLHRTSDVTEQGVIRTIKAMMNAEPAERPNAASLALIFTPGPCCLDWPNDKITFPGPHEELDGVEMCVQQDHVDCPVQRHSHGTGISDNSTTSLESWLNDCEQSHEACRQEVMGDLKFLPTRLIDVHTDGVHDSSVRLVDSALIQSSVTSPGYIALSHVWSNSQAVLTTQTLSDMQAGVLLRTLPQAVEQAVTVAKSLGHRYIWTDSLCILQDSDDDKIQECATMASVFRNATLTLVVEESTNDTLKESASTPSQGRNTLATTPPITTKSRSLAALATVDFSAPGFGWNTRAWVLQERLLSRRFLHLGEQMYWECNSLKASETFPRGLSPLVWEKVHSKNTEVIQISVNKPFANKSGPKRTNTTEDLQISMYKPRANKSIDSPDAKKQGDEVRRLAPSRLRDCQWIKKEGDGIGDSMVAAQTTLQLGNVKTISKTLYCSCKTAALQPTVDITIVDPQALPNHPCTVPSSTTTSRFDVAAHPGDNLSSPSMTASRSSRSRSIDTSGKSGRKDICASGQLDQHGLAGGKHNHGSSTDGHVNRASIG